MSDSSIRDRAKHGFTLFLQRINSVKAGDVAERMGKTDKQVSEIKNHQMEDAVALLSHLGLRVVDARLKTMSPITYSFLTERVGQMFRADPEKLFEDSHFGSE